MAISKEEDEACAAFCKALLQTAEELQTMISDALKGCDQTRIDFYMKKRWELSLSAAEVSQHLEDHLKGKYQQDNKHEKPKQEAWN